MPLKLTTYYRGSKVPDLPGTNTFHSTELFRIYEETPGYTPILIVASEDDKPVAKLLAAIRKSVRMFPPGIIKRCEVYGTGEYFNNEADKETIFSDMLQRLTNEALRDSFLIEFRNLEMPCSDTNLSETTNTSPSIGCGCATRCTASKRWKSVSARHVSGKSRKASKTVPKCGKHVPKRRFSVSPRCCATYILPRSAPLPQYQVLSASRKPVDKRAAKQNLHRHL